MTEDDVIRIAKKVNLVFRFDYFEIASENSDGIMINDLTKFANLVAAAERNRLISAADRCIVCEQRRIRNETTTKNEANL